MCKKSVELSFYISWSFEYECIFFGKREKFVIPGSYVKQAKKLNCWEISYPSSKASVEFERAADSECGNSFRRGTGILKWLRSVKWREWNASSGGSSVSALTDCFMNLMGFHRWAAETGLNFQTQSGRITTKTAENVPSIFPNIIFTFLGLPHAFSPVLPAFRCVTVFYLWFRLPQEVLNKQLTYHFLDPYNYRMLSIDRLPNCIVLLQNGPNWLRSKRYFFTQYHVHDWFYAAGECMDDGRRRGAVGASKRNGGYHANGKQKARNTGRGQ